MATQTMKVVCIGIVGCHWNQFCASVHQPHGSSCRLVWLIWILSNNCNM